MHLLCVLSRNLSIADFVGDIKRSSSKWVKTKGKLLTKFAWQNGYGVFSVGESDVERVKAYIAGQDKHHGKITFEDVYRRFLKDYGVEYDERYVWD